MLNYKKKNFTKLVPLILAQVFLLPGAVYPASSNKSISSIYMQANTLRVPMAFGGGQRDSFDQRVNEVVRGAEFRKDNLISGAYLDDLKVPKGLLRQIGIEDNALGAQILVLPAEDIKILNDDPATKMIFRKNEADGTKVGAMALLPKHRGILDAMKSKLGIEGDFSLPLVVAAEYIDLATLVHELTHVDKENKGEIYKYSKNIEQYISNSHEREANLNSILAFRFVYPDKSFYDCLRMKEGLNKENFPDEKIKKIYLKDNITSNAPTPYIVEYLMWESITENLGGGNMTEANVAYIKDTVFRKFNWYDDLSISIWSGKNAQHQLRFDRTHPAKKIMDILELNKNDTYLDLAGGAGTYTWAASSVYNVKEAIYLDISEPNVMIAKALLANSNNINQMEQYGVGNQRQELLNKGSAKVLFLLKMLYYWGATLGNIPNNATLIQGDARDMKQIKDNSITKLSVTELFNWLGGLEDQKSCIKEMLRVVKSGGRLYIVYDFPVNLQVFEDMLKSIAEEQNIEIDLRKDLESGIDGALIVDVIKKGSTTKDVLQLRMDSIKQMIEDSGRERLIEKLPHIERLYNYVKQSYEKDGLTEKGYHRFSHNMETTGLVLESALASDEEFTDQMVFGAILAGIQHDWVLGRKTDDFPKVPDTVELIQNMDEKTQREIFGATWEEMGVDVADMIAYIKRTDYSDKKEDAQKIEDAYAEALEKIDINIREKVNKLAVMLHDADLLATYLLLTPEEAEERIRDLAYEKHFNADALVSGTPGFMTVVVAPAFKRLPQVIQDKYQAQLDAVKKHFINLSSIDRKAPAFTQAVQGVFYERGYLVDSKRVGEGYRAAVYKAKELSTGKTVAIKIADPYGDSMTAGMCRAYCWAMKSQVEFWKTYGIFNHDIPVLVQLYDAGFISADKMKEYAPASDEELLKRLDWDYHYQILEFIEGKGLNRLLKDNFFKDKDIGLLIDSLIDLVMGINAMHEKGIAHGELLSKNISVLLDGKIRFKAVDLDPMKQGMGYNAWGKDNSYLMEIIFLVLGQASKDTINENIVKEFFAKWTKEDIIEKGLPSFAEALRELQTQIRGTTGGGEKLEEARDSLSQQIRLRNSI